MQDVQFLPHLYSPAAGFIIISEPRISTTHHSSEHITLDHHVQDMAINDNVHQSSLALHHFNHLHLVNRTDNQHDYILTSQATRPISTLPPSNLPQGCLIATQNPHSRPGSNNTNLNDQQHPVIRYPIVRFQGSPTPWRSQL
jgi:hypothetical protein